MGVIIWTHFPWSYPRTSWGADSVGQSQGHYGTRYPWLQPGNPGTKGIIGGTNIYLVTAKELRHQGITRRLYYLLSNKREYRQGRDIYEVGVQISFIIRMAHVAYQWSYVLHMVLCPASLTTATHGSGSDNGDKWPCVHMYQPSVCTHSLPALWQGHMTITPCTAQHMVHRGLTFSDQRLQLAMFVRHISTWSNVLCHRRHILRPCFNHSLLSLNDVVLYSIQN